jgi:hypothetical protein
MTPRTSPSPREVLLSLCDEWVGRSKLWFDPSQAPFAEFTTRGRIRKMGEGNFVAHEYEEAFDGKQHRSLAIYAFNDESQQFECSWIHSFHMNSAIMFATGTVSPSGFFVQGTYGDGQNGPRWGWRTEHELRAPDQLVITAFNISPEGVASKAVETVYGRRR